MEWPKVTVYQLIDLYYKNKILLESNSIRVENYFFKKKNTGSCEISKILSTGKSKIEKKNEKVNW